MRSHFHKILCVRVAEPGALVNSIPGFRQSFGDKVAFAKLHARCLEIQQRTQTTAKQPMFCDWTKRGFNIGLHSGELNAPFGVLREHSKTMAAPPAARHKASAHSYPQLWILKPQQSFNQMGISMVYLSEADATDDAAVQRWMGSVIAVDGWWTLQEYVQRPLLYRGRKFDLRVWAVVTSIDPLRIFLLRRTFPKISTVPYTASASVVGRHCLSSPYCSCMHVRMPMGDGCSASQLVDPYPEHTELSLFRRGLRFGRSFEGRGDPEQEGALWDRVVMPQIEHTISLAVLLARAEPLELHKRLLSMGLR